MIPYGYNLSTLVEHSDRLKQVRKSELQSGDCVLVKTHNSVYQILVNKDGTYVVSGGWFDRKGLSPTTITIAGCSWGGSAIKVDIVAACGLRLEFGNRLITSPIQKIFVLPRGSDN
ncbi:MAG: hypothetical protein AABZ02_09020 [Bacteroidota bacterium]